MGGLFGIEDHTWAEARHDGPAERPEEIGIKLAETILQNGGQEILDKIRHQYEKKK